MMAWLSIPAYQTAPKFIYLFIFKFLFIYDSHRERERGTETQAEGEAGSMHREPDVGFDPGSPGSRPGPKAGAKPLRHPGIPRAVYLYCYNRKRKKQLILSFWYSK